MRSLASPVDKLVLFSELNNLLVQNACVKRNGWVGGCLVSKIRLHDTHQTLDVLIRTLNVEFSEARADAWWKIFLANIGSRVHGGEDTEIRVSIYALNLPSFRQE